MFQVVAYFPEDKLTKGFFNMVTQELTWWKFVSRSLGWSRSQEAIITGKKDLQKVMVVESLIPIKVKVRNKTVEIIWLKLSETVLPLKLA